MDAHGLATTARIFHGRGGRRSVSGSRVSGRKKKIPRMRRRVSAEQRTKM
jgi:hypothetical protein